MGKAQKFKEIRKIEKENLQKKKEARNKFIVKASLVAIAISILLSGGLLGYKFYGEKYLGTTVAKISGLFKKDNKKEEKLETKSYKNGERSYSQAPDMQIDKTKKYIASFETNKGNFKVELLADKAPKTVNNFVVLSRDKFYDGLIFHRIIADFMIQGGDPEGRGTGGPGYKFEDEQNDVKLERGILAMANSGPNTNGSQFFIITKDNTDWLQGKHTAFGRVTDGLDVVMQIEKVEVGQDDKPVSEVKINKLAIEEK